MNKRVKDSIETVKVYHGYGHKDNLTISGHVLAGIPEGHSKFKSNPFYNIIHLIRLFIIRPVANAQVQLLWENKHLTTQTESDGYFRFEWASETELEAGWHLINVHLLDDTGKTTATGEGKIFVPHSTQYGFISDIDDTVLVSHSATTGKRLSVLFTRNPRSRKTFADVVRYYHLLATAHTDDTLLNPFFYVSSSEWNLYDDLNDFSKHNGLPKGVFLLNDIKRWYQLLKTGKTKHGGKLHRVTRILEVFPKQQFALLGDNSQSDPSIYVAIANSYPDQIAAIYIRNISIKKELNTAELLGSINNKNIPTCISNIQMKL